jgi:hypothetical protein
VRENLNPVKAITEKDGKAEIEIIPSIKLFGQGCYKSQVEQPAGLGGERQTSWLKRSGTRRQGAIIGGVKGWEGIKGQPYESVHFGPDGLCLAA